MVPLPQFHKSFIIIRLPERAGACWDDPRMGLGLTVMEKKQVENFKKRLLESQQQLRHTLDRTTATKDDALHDFGRDEGDRANASQSKEMTFLQAAQARGLISLIEGALGRISNGTFGECLNCGQEISQNRLTAVPWSRYCITCQEMIMERR